MNIARIAILAIVVIAGCSCTDTTDLAIEQARRDSRQQERALRELTNIQLLSADQLRTAIPPPQSSQADGSLTLEDLALVLRSVKFSPPIDDRSQLLFSEAEITNRQFAAYLHDTGQQRDDTAIVEMAEKVQQGITIVSPDGSSRTHVDGLSTGSPSIGIHQPAQLWKGSYPAGQHDYPVTFLTTAQASEFCTWLTARYELPGIFRLPSEQEWLAAAYGETRKYPWGDDEREWTGKSSEPVLSRPELRTPDGLYGMWGNVSELVLSASNGYGGELPDFRQPMITEWLGTAYEDDEIGVKRTQPRQDYWGYTHSTQSRSDTWGFRIVFAAH